MLIHINYSSKKTKKFEIYYNEQIVKGSIVTKDHNVKLEILEKNIMLSKIRFLFMFLDVVSCIFCVNKIGDVFKNVKTDQKKHLISFTRFIDENSTITLNPLDASIVQVIGAEVDCVECDVNNELINQRIAKYKKYAKPIMLSIILFIIIAVSLFVTLHIIYTN